MTVRRNPDSSVGPAVAQAVKQQKSKRMMMFGLRSVSELCSPGQIKYKYEKECSCIAFEWGLVLL